jgi:hypothetical protein
MVQRFVVIQYTIRPAGKLMMKVTKMSGRTMKIRRWVLSAVTDMKSVDTSWDPT